MTSERPPEPGLAQTRFQVAGWTVDPGARRLYRDGETVKVEPKVMRVLVYLAERQGEVVSRPELEAAVWSGMVVTYDAVTNTIIKLRRAFQDDPRQPRIIETLSKHGYRLIPEVRWLPARPRQARLTQPEAVPGTAPRKARSAYRLAALAALFVGLVLAAWLAVELGWFSRDRSAISAGPRPTVAVLPFDNLSTDPEDDYFSDGITADLITDLSKISGLQVVARDSAFAYRSSIEPARRIAEALRAGYILKGSVQRAGDKLRINVRLMDADTGESLWAERYERKLADIFAIQDEVTARIVSALEVELAPADRRRLARSHTASVAAYDEFLRGLGYYARRSRADNELAKVHFEKAIEIDPEFARAHAALALAYARDAIDSWGSVEDSLDRARQIVRRALALDESLPQAWFVLSQIALYEGQYAQAIDRIEQAIALRPGYADGYGMLAWILHFAGRPSEGLEAMQRAVRLNPQVPAIYRLVEGALHYELGNAPKAVAALEKASQISPHQQMIRVWLAAAYAAAGETEAARWEAQEVLALNPDFSLQDVERSFPIRDPSYRERFMADLAQAGLSY